VEIFALNQFSGILLMTSQLPAGDMSSPSLLLEVASAFDELSNKEPYSYAN
jgi:hypothetical protein